MELNMEAKKIKNRSETLIFILAILGILVVVNYFGVRMFTRLDMTEGKEYSISLPQKNLKNWMTLSLSKFSSLKTYSTCQQNSNRCKRYPSEYSAYAGKNLRISWEDLKKVRSKESCSLIRDPRGTTSDFRERQDSGNQGISWNRNSLCRQKRIDSGCTESSESGI
jgi:hypothetical protein